MQCLLFLKQLCKRIDRLFEPVPRETRPFHVGFAREFHIGDASLWIGTAIPTGRSKKIIEQAEVAAKIFVQMFRRSRMVDAVKLWRGDDPAKPAQIHLNVGMNETRVDWHVQGDRGDRINIRQPEEEKGDERQCRFHKRINDVEPVVGKDVHFLLGMMDRVEEPEDTNLVPDKMIRPKN
jgi:hypothetical protein